MGCTDETTPNECPEIVKPTVVESCPECAEGYIPSNCVTTSEAVPYLKIGKGTSFTNALKKIATAISNVIKNQDCVECFTTKTVTITNEQLLNITTPVDLLTFPSGYYPVFKRITVKYFANGTTAPVSTNPYYITFSEPALDVISVIKSDLISTKDTVAVIYDFARTAVSNIGGADTNIASIMSVDNGNILRFVSSSNPTDTNGTIEITIEYQQKQF